MTLDSSLLRACALGLAIAAPLPALAESQAALWARAERLALAGRCEEALAALDQIKASAPLDARALVVAGQCQTRLQRWPDAAASLAQARELDPKLPQIDLQLATAQFHADDLDGAEQSLARARAAGTTGPELEFYEAMVALARGRDPRTAAETLERAGRDRPATLDPAASYYAGLAWRSAADEDRSRAALERVVEKHPGTPWAEAAQRALDQPAAAGLALAPWASLTLGMEYSSNVAYLGNGLATPDEIDSKGDWGGVWSVDAGTPLAKLGRTTIGVRGFYTGSAHFDVSDYDLQHPGGAFWLDHPTGERSLLRVEAGGGFAWLGYEPYLASAWLSPQWFYDHGEWGTTRLHSAVTGYDFQNQDDDENVPSGTGVPGSACPRGEAFCGPPGLNERNARDRDGIGVYAGVEHTLPLNDGKTRLRGGPIFDYYTSRGQEWDSWGVGAELGVRQQLPWALTLDVAGRYLHRFYDNPSTYPDPDDVLFGVEYPLSNDDREEDWYEVDVRLERPINRWLTATLRYDYLRNDSNTAVFDYDRHLAGGYLTITWQGAPR